MGIVYPLAGHPFLDQRGSPRLVGQTAGQAIGDVHGLPGESTPFRIAKPQALFDAVAILVPDVRGQGSSLSALHHIPERSGVRSGLRSEIRGAGAPRLGFPSRVLGTPAVG